MNPTHVRIYSMLAALAAVACSDSGGPDVPTHLDFVVEPSPAARGQTISPAVVVAARDENGSTVLEWPEDVSLLLESGPAGVSLEGECVTPPVGGTAVFRDLSLDAAAEGYRIRATSEGLEGAVSRSFTVHDVFTGASVTAGWTHTCALDQEGAAWCWGDNDSGQLGDGTLASSTIPVRVDTDLRFTSLQAGAAHTCGITTGGDAWCWGMNLSGQLGSGARTEIEPPSRVAAAQAIVSLGAGWTHTCGITESGGILCWGNNGFGQVGDGTSGTERASPVPVRSEDRFVDVSGGFFHTCGLTADGRALCWGRNNYGEVGDGTQEPRSEPTPVSGDLRFTSLKAGGSGCHYHTCGVATDGKTYCWGRNYQRHLSAEEIFLLTPTPIADDPGLERVVVGANAVCGLTGEGALHCWGTGYYGQVGNGSTEATRTPTHIRPDLRFSSVSPGRYHTCAVTEDGGIHCWGLNESGQLGNEAAAQGWAVPVPVWAPVQ